MENEIAYETKMLRKYSICVNYAVQRVQYVR